MVERIRKCVRCGSKIERCMGSVLARDIVNRREIPREFCSKCALITRPDEIEDILDRSYE